VTYQEIFNIHIKTIRNSCNATGNPSLAKVLIKSAFDLSDALKDNDLIKKGDKDNDNEQKFNR